MDYDSAFESAVEKWSHRQQSEQRFAHTERVVHTATLLAHQWAPASVMQCRLAGWIHDSAKHFDAAALLQMAQSYGLEVTPSEAQTPQLLHGAVGYARAAEHFQFEDEQIRTACTYHTTGHPDMNLNDKIVYLADLIEPARDFPSVDLLRELAYEDIDQAVLFSAKHTMMYLLEKDRTVDPRVLLLYNQLARN